MRYVEYRGNVKWIFIFIYIYIYLFGRSFGSCIVCRRMIPEPISEMIVCARDLYFFEVLASRKNICSYLWKKEIKLN